VKKLFLGILWRPLGSFADCWRAFHEPSSRLRARLRMLPNSKSNLRWQARSRSARLGSLTVSASLGTQSLTRGAGPTWPWLRAPPFRVLGLCVFPLSLLSDSSPWSSFLAAATGRAAALLVTSSPSPLPATSIHQVCPPLLLPSAVRDGAPQTLAELFCIRIWVQLRYITN